MGDPDLERDRWFWGHTANIAEEATASLNASSKRGDLVDRILNRLHSRLMESVSVIHTIRERHTAAAMADAGAILRTMYDVCLQGMYLVKDRARSHELADDFFAFYEIERHKIIEKVKKHAGLPFADRLLNSPKRAPNEAASNKAIEAAKHKFLIPGKKGKFYENWYKMNLRELAEELGLEAEYDFIITMLHGPIHTTPFFLFGRNGTLHTSIIEFCAWSLVMRLFAGTLRYHDISPTGELKEAIELGSENLITAFAHRVQTS